MSHHTATTRSPPSPFATACQNCRRTLLIPTALPAKLNEAPTKRLVVAYDAAPVPRAFCSPEFCSLDCFWSAELVRAQGKRRGKGQRGG
eukprot:CAMPEP_0184712100 /NCGR_PEP_ID=MMETSP0314-20130426/2698_1 /TAXON_ID=38298 /ORGANISM="Rhodella maculata, Strain CCMP 736" /LENGTH=88 /DNA_ID=CAMNT_0027174455 /DNA_START=62 /DNA_END=324 /DNA_ORIENTATION=+